MQMNPCWMKDMEEKRKYFRIKNPGSIKATYDKHDLYVIDISPAGAHIISKDINIKPNGVIDVVIHYFSNKINYELLKKQGDENIVTFKDEKEISTLLAALKNLRDHMHIELESSPHHNSAIPFNKPKIENFIKLNSLHSIRLYQILRQYTFSGGSIISLDDLRVALGVENFRTYNVYGALKKNIIEPSIKEINAKTELTVLYTEVKEGRKTVALKFTLVGFDALLESRQQAN